MATRLMRTGARIALEVGGVDVDALQRFSGLDPQADIATGDLEPSGAPKKHVSNVRWTPGRATVGIDMGRGLYAWLRSTLATGEARGSGALRVADFNGRVVSALDFSDARITAFGVPGLDGASKAIGAFDIDFETERVVWPGGADRDLQVRPSARPKAWLCSNFRVEIGTLPCQRVASVDAFTWQCRPAPDPLGLREPVAPRGSVTVPDLRLTISQADIGPWAEAARRWFVDGEHQEANEMSGRLSFLGPDLQETLGSIELMNVGFKSFERMPDLSASSDHLGRFAVGLYVEQMALRLEAYEP